MASLGQWLEGLFAFLGAAGTLVGLFVVFVVDAAIIPTLPELAVVLSYTYRGAGVDPFFWALLLLAMAMAGEAVGNTALYIYVRRALVDRGHMPRLLTRAIRRWTGFLLVRDERIILVNRVAPVVPFVGAFIAVLSWSYPKSLSYVLIGAAAKYTFLLVLVAYLGLVYDPATATIITIVAIVALVGLSVAASWAVRRRLVPPPEGQA